MVTTVTVKIIWNFINNLSEVQNSFPFVEIFPSLHFIVLINIKQGPPEITEVKIGNVIILTQPHCSK